MKILLVEDHAFLAQATCMMLRELHGHEVQHVTTAAAAIEALASGGFDVALLDINLPDEDGYALAAKIRQRADLDGMILVALTGIGSDIDGEKAAAAGIDAHYLKPMDFTVLPELKRRDGRA